MRAPMVYLTDLAIALAAAVWFALLAANVTMLRRVRALPHASDPGDASRDAWPTLTVVTPACDEAGSIEAAMRSLLAQDYAPLDVVAVDDRSRDGTGAILDALAADDPRLAVVHVTELPDGWLGKLHALERGVAHASGEWLLFADADVVFERHALRDAIRFAEDSQLDFLTALPTVESAGLVGDVALTAAGTLFAASRPWRSRDPTSRAIAGMGAFMLVRRSAFARTPGFAWLALEVADDMGLALMLKSSGGVCDVVNATAQLRLHWYRSYGEIARRMQKNLFAILGRFSVARSLALALVLAWLGLFPLAAIYAPVHGPVRVLGVAGAVASVLTAVGYARWARRSQVPAVFVSVGMVLLAAAMVRAAFVGWRIGGIEWRGRRYPSALLARAQRVRV